MYAKNTFCFVTMCSSSLDKEVELFSKSWQVGYTL
jgi:hypothetical protein